MTQAPTQNLATAIRDGLIEAARDDPSVLFFAEGVQDPAALFGTLKGLGDVVDASRLIEMPIAENGLIGIAIGAAMAGHRPVVSLQRVEFALLAMEQILNNAAKAHYVSNGQHRIPLVIRMVVGRGWGQGPEHSQSLEAMFAHVPGLKIVMPAFAEDAKGMVISAVEDDNPVLVFEHRWSHYATGEVPDGKYRSALDGPRRIRRGENLTVVATSYCTLEALRAVTTLEAMGYPVDLFDLRVIRPLELSSVYESVQRTGRLVTVDTGFRMLGIGAEIAASVTTECFDALRAAPVRLGLPDHPTPSSRGMVHGFYPDAISIGRACGEVIGLSNDEIVDMTGRIAKDREGIPTDVPDPFFRGPF